MNRAFIDATVLWPSELPAPRPNPALLGANERRRAPDSVLVALEVAQAAVMRAGVDAATTASVFTSAHGDLAIVDALCRTLAADPALLSPTRFHHSVHNAASGYWAIASGSRAPSTALAAGPHSFAAGWLEAACQCAADARAVLLVGVDTGAVGALASVNRSAGLLGLALVLAPRAGPRSCWAVEWKLLPGAAEVPPLRSAVTRALAGNAMAGGLPLFEALLERVPAHCALPLSPTSHLSLVLQPLPRAGASAPDASSLASP